jgi:endonuclease I
MKKINLLFVCLLMSALSFAQATLPLSWNFANNVLPEGFTETNVNTAAPPYYTGSVNPQPAYKLDATGDILMIQVVTTPGAFTYDLTGNSFSGGTFLVEESEDGSVWNTLHTFTAPPSGYTGFTETPDPLSRYFRFYYQNKVSGNVGIDNVEIEAGVSSNQEILVAEGANTIVNGQTFYVASPVATTTPVTFSIQNLGLATLNVSSMTLSGSEAADFELLTAAPLSVSAQSSADLIINFTPAANGSRHAVLTIDNDDINANPYVINLFGIGGTLASEPADQPVNLSFGTPKSYRINATFFDAVSNPDGYVVLRSNGSPVIDVPVDGIAYERGDVIGAAQVVNSGDIQGFSPSNIIANTQYYFSVFAFNGNGQFTNYNTTNPLAGNITSSGSMQPADYYSSVSTSSPSFVTQLHNKINPHFTQFYGSYGPLMVEKFFARDTTNNQRVVTCAYSGLNELYNQPFDWTTNDFAREHTYPQSWMPTVNASDFDSRPEYSDYHMITPANQNNVNALRSNYPLGVVVTPTYTFMGCKKGQDANGNIVFEPQDSYKGNAARSLFYQTACYSGVAYNGPANTDATYGGSWSLPQTISSNINYGQDQYVLKMWHYQDPPDNFEIARNDYVDSLQENRNPFIDSVHFACYIDFSNMNYIPNPVFPCNTVGLSDVKLPNVSFMIAPNPNAGVFNLIYDTKSAQNVVVNIYDQTGRVVFSKQSFFHTGTNNLPLDISHVNQGMYIVDITTENEHITDRLIIH